MDRKIIVVCGSTQFMKEIASYCLEQTKKGNLMLFSPFAKEDYKDLEEYREELFEQHKQKMRLADEILIFNYKGHVGEHTRDEIQYAYTLGKPIKFLEDI